MHTFLHKCLVLVEATGLESELQSLKAFIFKGFRVMQCQLRPKTLILFECHQALQKLSYGGENTPPFLCNNLFIISY